MVACLDMASVYNWTSISSKRFVGPPFWNIFIVFSSSVSRCVEGGANRTGAMILFALCVVFGISIIVKYMVYKRHMESFVKNLPTLEPCYPLVGCAFEFVGKSSAQIFKDTVETVKNHSTPCKTWVGPLLLITVDKPEDVKTVLMSSACLDKPYIYRFLPSSFGILTAASTYP